MAMQFHYFILYPYLKKPKIPAKEFSDLVLMPKNFVEISPMRDNNDTHSMNLNNILSLLIGISWMAYWKR
ncbi:hypothetical protein IEQ34_006029 [Dendrobium chrysotoxum]|uniref:Uncharacterized protein n=1 Tax=Dendrobium chrysotoxum TaxID=161865 RepID=A0AAV7HAK7_DENCH|nr:hypothetical protein IEQ34_006029 [Dendrobium chrysotoxum]